MATKLITEAGFYNGQFRPAGQTYDDGIAEGSESTEIAVSDVDGVKPEQLPVVENSAGLEPAADDVAEGEEGLEPPAAAPLVKEVE